MLPPGLARVTQLVAFEVIHPAILIFFLVAVESATAFVVVGCSFSLRPANVGRVLRFVIRLLRKLTQITHTRLLPSLPPLHILLRAKGQACSQKGHCQGPVGTVPNDCPTTV